MTATVALVRPIWLRFTASATPTDVADVIALAAGQPVALVVDVMPAMEVAS